jgi:hypothetical protein
LLAPRLLFASLARVSFQLRLFCFSLYRIFADFYDRLLGAAQDISDQCKILYWFSRQSAYSKQTTPFSLAQISSQFFLREGQVHTRNIQVWVHQGLSV